MRQQPLTPTAEFPRLVQLSWANPLTQSIGAIHKTIESPYSGLMQDITDDISDETNDMVLSEVHSLIGQNQFVSAGELFNCLNIELNKKCNILSSLIAEVAVNKDDRAASLMMSSVKINQTKANMVLVMAAQELDIKLYKEVARRLIEQTSLNSDEKKDIVNRL